MSKNRKPICTICKRVLLAEEGVNAVTYTTPDNTGDAITYYICGDCNEEYKRYLAEDIMDEWDYDDE